MPYADKTKRRIHTAWKNMRARCTNPNHREFNRYGARGIMVCKEWESFEPFYIWSLENGYDEHLSIDRVDVNGNYEPSNCRWTTWDVQVRNRRNNHYLECNGRKMIISDWARELGISEQGLSERINSGNWTIEEALTIPPMSRKLKEDLI